MSAPPSPPLDMHKVRSQIRARAVLAILVCGGTLAGAMWFLPRCFEFPVPTAERLAFALMANLFILAWLIGAIAWVSTIRRFSAEDNVGSAYAPPSDQLKVPAAFLQNTLEQSVITSAGLLAVSTVRGDAPLAFKCAAVPLFALGRWTFLRGYPAGAVGRAFGMAVTALPGLAAILWAIANTLSRLAAGFSTLGHT